MSAGGRTIYVAGAGIASLTLALTLAKFGATVIVLERNKSIQEVGAGLQISPNARHILNRLGLDKAVQQHAFEPAGIDVYPFRARRPLVTLALGQAATKRYRAPYAVLHRADLAEILHRACKRFASIDILFGVRSYDVVSHARGISVTVEEADGKTRSARAFAFVGADGVNSPTRTSVLLGREAEYSGFVAWRNSLPMGSFDGLLASDRTSLLFGPGYHATCYPLLHRRQINMVLVTRAKAAEMFGGRPPAAPTLPWSALPSAQFSAMLAVKEGWGLWPIKTVDASAWHAGGVGLIGDAAHAMLPFQAQGAAMAIEDAAILGPLLMTEPDAAEAFARFTSIRRRRVERVRNLSRANAIAFHLEWPFTLARDAVLTLQGSQGHLKRLDWLYGYDVAPDPAISSPRPAPQAAND